MQNDRPMDWRDALLAKLDYHCTRFNRAEARLRGRINKAFPYIMTGAVVLWLSVSVVAVIFRAILRNEPLHAYLNQHDWLAYACLAILFGILPLGFVGAALYLTRKAVQPRWEQWKKKKEDPAQ